MVAQELQLPRTPTLKNMTSRFPLHLAIVLHTTSNLNIKYACDNIEKAL